MITIIYPYRSRAIERMKKSFDSLLNQTNTNFKVVFVDYGSPLEISKEVKNLIAKYDFIEYFYSYNVHQPWSRSKAINIGLRFVKTEYVFIADIDIIFHENFINKLNSLKKTQSNIYFQVGYLKESESSLIKNFNEYKIDSKSIPEGKGLSFFKVSSLLSVNGFDEFYHFWGAEDEDVYVRLKNFGDKEFFYNEEVLLLHQWHPTFQSLENEKLTAALSFTNTFRLNKQKLRFNQENKLIKANSDDWGFIFNEEAYNSLNNKQHFKEIINKKNNIDYFINIVLNNFSGLVKVRFIKDKYQKTLKYKIKKLFRIEKNEYYSLKQVNDAVLLHLILHHNKCPYIFKVNTDLESIDFIIMK